MCMCLYLPVDRHGFMVQYILELFFQSSSSIVKSSLQGKQVLTIKDEHWMGP